MEEALQAKEAREKRREEVKEQRKAQKSQVLAKKRDIGYVLVSELCG